MTPSKQASVPAPHAREVWEVSRRIAEEHWGRAMPSHTGYGISRGWRDLTTGVADPIPTARAFVIDSFGAILDNVAKELDVEPTLVEGHVALALCPPAHHSRDDSEPPLVGDVTRVTEEIRAGLTRAASGKALNSSVANLLSHRAALDALATIALQRWGDQRSMPSDAIPYRPNALLVTAVYIEDISRWACAQLNRMLYGQLAPIGEDPFTSRLGDGFGLEIAHSLAAGGCVGIHDDPSCTRRRHNIRLWSPSTDGEPPSLFYWLLNLLVGPRAPTLRAMAPPEANDGVLIPREGRLQAGALRESILPYRLNLGVLKALVLRCRDCDRKLDGVSQVCLQKVHATNWQCDVYAQFDDKRVILNPVAANPAPIRCQTCSGAVHHTGVKCPGCGELVSVRRRSHKTFLPDGVTHPVLKAFAHDIDHSDSEEAVVAALCRSLRRFEANVGQSARLVADELDIDLQEVIEIAERHAPTLRACLMEADYD